MVTSCVVLVVIHYRQTIEPNWDAWENEIMDHSSLCLNYKTNKWISCFVSVFLTSVAWKVFLCDLDCITVAMVNKQCD